MIQTELLWFWECCDPRKIVGVASMSFWWIYVICFLRMWKIIIIIIIIYYCNCVFFRLQ